MKMLSRSILENIGNTPLLRIEIEGVELFLKLEMFNPGGSIKDRVALAIIEDAEKKGELSQKKAVIEATSGNTGIGLVLVCAAKGYKCIIVMPENMSEERKKILRAYGAELILTPAEEGIPGAVKKVEELVRKDPEKYFHARQFENPVNPLIHYETTAVEILEQMGVLPEIFVAGVGTGGTLTGIGKRFKEVNPECLLVAVEPDTSAVISGKPAGVHKIQGIGAGFIPKVLDVELIDKVETVSFEEAKKYSNLLASRFGILSGISAGANVRVAIKVAKETGKKKRVVTILPDTGERYLSTDLFD
ncbi:cysteine synthase A [Desulfurobacterium thermolithotrophum DSM 11699]|uniref:Cysteine synthase n=2 Tax=Desulfurobacterium thermolithotrophum TaxID=64160 RepID=F0S412_DESTD|nr:cysteine synthase A [Desulfurobacterium thermolithotrophum]ADY73584.1 cysteine synthase A [Desulfurobacterium thermolithotrophum DSM 11699]